MTEYRCADCGKEFPASVNLFRCRCGGLLNLCQETIPYQPEHVRRDRWHLFRYRSFLPFDDQALDWEEITLGEGMTPLIQPDGEDPLLLAKQDYLMPTLSFKDRGAAVMIAYAKALGVRQVVQDSSGNAGCSVAAYAARAGMTCDIYVPESTSTPKIRQIEVYGATVHLIPGSREDTALAALSAIEQSEAFYASHVYQPVFYQGTKTYMYEIFEQLGGRLPDTILLPAGNGTLLLGVYAGLRDLKAGGAIHQFPRLVAVQAANCAPLYHSFIRGLGMTEHVVNEKTMAEGIAVADPKRGKEMIQALRHTKGMVVTVAEESIQNARHRLASKGIDVEPTAAVCYAAYLDHRMQDKSIPWGLVVLPFCGSGLKK
ncbi:MAG: threonine synthase [Bacillota bacterium]|nr:threonine synthase [Bacillota bacterium]MDW7677904.1 threonine synthase [Bacillota bacterium]